MNQQSSHADLQPAVLFKVSSTLRLIQTIAPKSREILWENIDKICFFSLYQNYYKGILIISGLI